MTFSLPLSPSRGQIFLKKKKKNTKEKNVYFFVHITQAVTQLYGTEYLKLRNIRMQTRKKRLFRL